MKLVLMLGILACVSGGPVYDCDQLLASGACNDGKPCTKDSCTSVLGCTHTLVPPGTPCDDFDSNACTIDRCSKTGQCISKPRNCNDNNPCTKDSCDPASHDGCVHTPLNGPKTGCNRKDPCSYDTCKIGNCITKMIKCPADSNPCTRDYCNPDVGCVNSVDPSLPCSDNNICTSDKCDSTGVCVGTVIVPPPAGCGNPGCGDCNDNNACTKDWCETATGVCHHDFNTGPCEADGKPCTVDYCVQGQCITLGAQICDDGNGCTRDTCSDDGGCIFTPDPSLPCSDNNKCTKDACDASGACIGTLIVPPPAGCTGPPFDCQQLNCNDKNVCTKDSCLPDVGCVHVPISGPCDDGNKCTDNWCKEGKCVVAGLTICDDGKECTRDDCKADTGCVFTPSAALTCSDGNVCTSDKCDDAGNCVSTLIVPPVPPCKSPPFDCASLNCDDNNECTEDFCTAALGCQHVVFDGPCDDGNKCTVNRCKAGHCAYVGNVNCDDGNSCTLDDCNPSTGCVYSSLATCDDGNRCTVDDRCTDRGCEGTLASCDDGDRCTKDYCSPVFGCLHTSIIPCEPID